MAQYDTAVDVRPSRIHPSIWYSETMRGKLKEWEDKYHAFVCNKVVIYTDFAVRRFVNHGTDPITGSSIHFEHTDNIGMIWHKNRDGTAEKISLKIPDLRNKDAMGVFFTKLGKVHRFKNTWYCKPKQYVSPEGGKFSGIDWESLITFQGSTHNEQLLKQIVFGPIVPDIKDSTKHQVHIDLFIKHTVYYYFTFAGKRVLTEDKVSSHAAYEGKALEWLHKALIKVDSNAKKIDDLSGVGYSNGPPERED